jgi:hypothetical protein
MPGTIVQINFKFDGSKDEYLKTFRQAAEPIAAAGGLRWKVWPWNDAERMGGGIYLFEDDASAQAYLEGPIIAGLDKVPGISEVSVRQFQVLDSLTAVTRGPV